jgi:hypothetical protein
MSRSFLVALIALIGLVASLAVPAQAQIPNWMAGQPQSSGISVFDPSKVSHPTCGGIETWKPGWPAQPACAVQPAIYEGPSTGLEECKNVLDVGRLECWRCDPGFERTAAAVDTPRACARRQAGATQQFARATLVGAMCPAATNTHEKSFWDPIRGGECWACPRGFNRSAAHVEWADACVKPAGLTRANRHGQSTGLIRTDCPSGQFWDAWSDGGGPYCWTCPAGTTRTGNHIAGGEACVASAQQARATPTKIGSCEAGSFSDLRKGMECWKCPEAYDRTVEDVSGPRACETTPGLQFARATLVQPLACPAGQHWDPTSVTQDDMGKRVFQLRGPRSTTTNGATCWSCPPEHKRSWSSVKARDACVPEKSISWQTAPYLAPGLFALDGAADVAVEILRDHAGDVDTLVKLVARNPAEATATWQEIAGAPQSSPVLAAVMLHRMSLAAVDPAKATDAEKKLLADFVRFVQHSRTYIAQDALNAFDAWLIAERYRLYRAGGADKGLGVMIARARTHEEAVKELQTDFPHLLKQTGTASPQSGTAQSVGMPAPDWYASVLASSVGGLGLAGITTGVIMSSPTLRYAVFPAQRVRAGIKARAEAMAPDPAPQSGGGGSSNIARVTAKVQSELQGVGDGTTRVGTKWFSSGKTLTTPMKKSLEEAAKKAAQEAEKAAARAAKWSTRFATAAVIAVTLILDVAIEVALHYDEIAQLDRPHLVTLLNEAKGPVDVARLTQTDGGQQTLISFWSQLMSRETAPSSVAAGQIKVLATAAAATAVPATAVAVKPAAQAAQVAAVSSDPRTMPKYFNGVQAMGPYVWQDGAAAIAAGLRGAVIGGQEGGQSLPLCRASYQNGVHPGKLWRNNCNIGWGGKEIALSSGFQVLVRSAAQQNEQYFPTDNWRAPNELPPAATFYAGYEGQTWMRVCRAQYNNNWHPGKEHNGRCNISWGGKEMVMQSYQVLSLFNTAVGGNRNGN